MGMALNYAEKMKAEAPTPRQTLVHELVSEFSMSLRNLGFNDRRDAPFRWIAQSLQTIMDTRPIIKRSATTTSQQTTWLKDTAPLDPAWKKKVQHTYKLLVDTIVAYPDCLKVTRGPATIAPIDLVMMALLVFEFQDKLTASRLSNALHALRMAARQETRDLMWKSEHMGHYVVFLDRLQRHGDAGSGPSNPPASDAPVSMDVDPPAKRQRTGGMPFHVVRDDLVYSAHGILIDYSPVSLSTPAQPQRVSINIPLGKQQPSSASPSTTRPPTSASPNPASTPTPNSLAALESMVSTFSSRPTQKVDRLAALRAAKAAIQAGRHPGPHPQSPRPSVAPVMGGGGGNGGMGGGGSGLSGPSGGGGPSM
jgi:hypothetical protein